jgi:uncharacterized glyoxalase superfamily protein PhnB
MQRIAIGVLLAALAGALGAVVFAGGNPRIAKEREMAEAKKQAEQKMKRLTPVLAVEAIEPVLPFWTERLGFTKTAEVPHGDRLGFVILERDGIQVMYQTWASIEGDVAALARERRGPAFLFLEVASIEDVVARMQGVEPVVPLRKTFYGATELIVREPGGHVVTFAEFAAQP